MLRLGLQVKISAAPVVRRQVLQRLVWGVWLVFSAVPQASTAREDGFRAGVNSQVAAARHIAPDLGVMIADVATGETKYTFRADVPRILASNTKLFTSAAALDQLGPGFFFETKILVRGELQSDGVLSGDVAIVGGGDPNLSGRHYFGDSYGPFREWTAVLAELGIRRIDGDLVFVSGAFDDQWVHPDWPRDQLEKWYEAPVASLTFNDSCVLLKVRPAWRAGAAARVELVPPLAMFEVENSARTTSRSSAERVRFGRAESAGGLQVSGWIHRGTESRDSWIAVHDPVTYFAAAVRSAFSEEGIVVSGRNRIVEDLDPGARWRVVHSHLSDLLTTLEIINKRSQNLYAESLIKLMGSRLCGEGSWAKGTKIVYETVRALDVGVSGLALADGSGMSRKNRASPRTVVELLARMYHHRWSDEYLRTLPFSGERDLKWESRLAQTPYLGNVLAKTGYLSGVSTLSGYAKARSGRLYAFSLLLNRASGRQRAENAQDKIVKAIIDFG